MKNKAKSVELELELPGFSKKDISVKIQKNRISVNAEKKHKKKIQKKDYFHEEQSYSSFSYMTTVPEIEPKKGKIKFSKGKLNISAPKK